MDVNLTRDEMLWAIDQSQLDCRQLEDLPLREHAREFFQFWSRYFGDSVESINAALDNEALIYRLILIPELVTRRITESVGGSAEP